MQRPDLNDSVSTHKPGRFANNNSEASLSTQPAQTKQFRRFASTSYFDSNDSLRSNDHNKPWKTEEKGEEVEFPVAGKSMTHNCHVAKTSFLLPYQWSTLPSTITPSEYVASLCERTLMSHPDGKLIKLWKEKTVLPHAIEDLDPRFREIIGWKEKNEFNRMHDHLHSFDKDYKHAFSNMSHEKRTEATYEKRTEATFDYNYEHSQYHDHLDSESVCRHLILTKEAMLTLFPATSLVAKVTEAGIKKYSLSSSSDSEEDGDLPDNIFSKKVTVSRVEITVLPLGSAVLSFTLNWNPKRSLSFLSIEELRTWLFLSKFRNKVFNGFQGWRLNEKMCLSPPDVNIQQFLGKHITSSLFFGIPISLSNIGNWLLMQNGEDVDSPPHRLSPYVKTSYHHTVVVLRQQPTDEMRNEYLFHLRRALGQTNRPPLSTSNNGSDYDIILQNRKNRFIAISLEGVVSLSWPATENLSEDFEIKKWHKIFFGVFLILSVHVIGEKSILKEFSNLSASVANVLKEIIRDDFELNELSTILKKLYVLSGLVTCYTLQLSSDDCGGHTEYIEFFSALRRVFRVLEQRRELEHEIEDILKLVQNDYIEGLLERTENELTKKTQERRLGYLKSTRNSKDDLRFTIITAGITASILPLFTIPQIFGSNIFDNGYPSFWVVIGVGISISFCIGLVFFLLPLPAKSLEEKSIKNNLEIVSFRYLQKERDTFQPDDEIILLDTSTNTTNSNMARDDDEGVMGAVI